MPNIEQAIQNFLQRIASPEEEKKLYEWINQNPENRKKLFREKDLWDALQIGTQKLNRIELNEWLVLQRRLSTRKLLPLKVTRFGKAAAVIMLALCIGWMGHYLYTSGNFINQQTEFKTIETPKGQLKEIYLADGTHIWLNAESKLSFPSGFSADNREVNLSGEAFFEVTANEKKPFLVKTGNHTVKVVGTRFNICEYPENKIIETTLIEGKVKIITGNIIKDLLPGQQSSFDTQTSKIRISANDFEIYTSWKDGRYEFNNEPINKVFQIVERWWDVKINYPVKLGNERISGVLKRHKPVDQLFGIIGELVPIEYKIINDEITITCRK